MRRLRAERLRRRLTQVALGGEIGVHPTMLSSIEHGYSLPRPFSPTARALVKFFGIPIATLLEEIPDSMVDEILGATATSVVGR